MRSNRRFSLQLLPAAFQKLKRAERGKEQEKVSKIPDEEDEERSTLSSLPSEKTLAATEVSSTSTIKRRRSARSSSLSFGLVKGFASIAARSHPNVRDGIVLQSLRMLREEFPLMERFDATEIFRNIIEVMGSENPKVQRDSLELLMLQIISGHDDALVSAIVETTDIDFTLTASKLNTYTMTVWDERQRQGLLQPLQDMFTTCPPSCHPLTSYVQFILKVCQQGSPFPLAVTWANFDDLVLSVCLSELSDISIRPKQGITPAIYEADELFSSCLQVLNLLASNNDARQLLRRRYDLIHTFWPPRQRHEFVRSSYCLVMSRMQAQDPLQAIEKQHIELRFSGIEAALGWTEDPSIVNYPKLSKELVQLSRNSRGDQAVGKPISSCLARYIGSWFHKAGWPALYAQLMLSPYAKVVDLLFVYTNYVLRCSSVSLPVFADDTPPPKYSTSRQLVSAYLDFADGITREHETLRTAFVEAGILSLQTTALGRDEEYWKRFRYRPSVPLHLRNELVEVLEQGKNSH